jgi:uncharacterized membrane protein (UPF0136 family)
MSDDLVPRSLLLRTIQYGWILILMMLVGGLVGYLFHLSRPPLYESSVTFTFSFDFARLGQLQQIEEDQAMGAAGALIDNTTAVEKLSTEAAALGLLPPGYELLRSISSERKSYRWIFHVRHPDPQAARRIADLWGELGLASLKEAAAHAEKANIAQHELNGLESCLHQMAVIEPATAQCGWPTLPYVQRAATTLSQKYLDERAASRGLVVGLSHDLTTKADIPTQPVSYGVNLLVLAGGLIGFGAGFLLITTTFPEWIMASGRHVGKTDPKS